MNRPVGWRKRIWTARWGLTGRKREPISAARCVEVVEQINELPRAKRTMLRRALTRITDFPDAASDYRESSPRGIPIDVHLAGGFAIKYWIDFADRHVKVLDLEPADRS